MGIVRFESGEQQEINVPQDAIDAMSKYFGTANEEMANADRIWMQDASVGPVTNICYGNPYIDCRNSNWLHGSHILEYTGNTTLDAHMQDRLEHVRRRMESLGFASDNHIDAEKEGKLGIWYDKEVRPEQLDTEISTWIEGMKHLGICAAEHNQRVLCPQVRPVSDEIASLLKLNTYKQSTGEVLGGRNKDKETARIDAIIAELEHRVSKGATLNAELLAQVEAEL